MRPGRYIMLSFLVFTFIMVAALIAFSQRLAKQAQQTWKTDVVYAERGERQLKLDVYRAPGSTNTQGCVIFVHGGGWATGNKKQLGMIASLTAQQGFTGVAISYRLTQNGENPYPAACEDLNDAIRWVRAQADELMIDPDRIGLMGGSAGGHLVSLHGLRQGSDTNLPPVQAVIDLFGPSDLQADSYSPGIRKIIENFMGGEAADMPEAYKAASPIHHVSADAPPFLISHGDEDNIVPESESANLHAALLDAGANSTYLMYEGEGHGQYQREAMIDYKAALIDFCREHLSPR